MISAVIFDMDGLLFDTEHLAIRFWVEAGEIHGFDISEPMLTGAIGMDETDTRQWFLSQLAGEFPFDAVNQTRYELTEKYICQSGIPLKSGAKEILSELKERGIPMAVASSTAIKIVETHLAIGGLRHFFSVVIGGDLVKRGKPHPDIFIMAAEQLNINPQDCVVFEDSQKGIKAAHAAGMRPVMIPDILNPAAGISRLCFKQYPSLQNAVPHLDQILF